MKVRKIMPVRDAWQYTGPGTVYSRPQWALKCTLVQPSNGVLVFIKRNDRAVIKRGDWLVQNDHPGKDPEHLTSDEMRAAYDFVGEKDAATA